MLKPGTIIEYKSTRNQYLILSLYNKDLLYNMYLLTSKGRENQHYSESAQDIETGIRLNNINILHNPETET